jgi:uncharacterized protein (TIGR03083 family)
VLSARVHAERERKDFADFLATLTAEQWSAPSLCAGWSVPDVVAHTIAYLSQSRTELFVGMVRNRWDVDKLNVQGLKDRACIAPDRLVELMRHGAEPFGAGALYGSRVALIECLVHQQDVRRPLGIPRFIPPDRLRMSLQYARVSPVIGGARRTRGLRLVATDMDWSAGRGLQVRGSGEALLLAMTGRCTAVVDELAGPGMALLR